MHAIHWFEIPVVDLPRATEFYGAVLGIKQFRREQAGAASLAIFPYDKVGQGVGGALIQGGSARPADASTSGVVIYLNAAQDIHGAVERAVAAGGGVKQPVTDIGDPGLVALIQDSEGNVVGLHQARASRSN